MNSQPKTSESHPIIVPFIHDQWGEGKGALGITFAPGKKQLNSMSG
jgi:hypothetical protein